MSDYRDDEDAYQDELDESYKLNRDQAGDDFDNFDASRYIRNRRRPLGDPDPDAIELEPYQRRGRSTRRPRADDEELDLPARRSNRRTAGQTSAGRGRTRRVAEDDDGPRSVYASTARGGRRGRYAREVEREPGLLDVVLGACDPGLRWIVIGIGCFAIMLLIGVCGLGIWLLDRLF